MLAGDPLQLGAVLRSHHAKRYHLDLSLLERLIQRPLYRRDETKFADHGSYDPFLVSPLTTSTFCCFLSFPFCRGEAGHYLSFCFTATFVILFTELPVVGLFSPLFSSPAFLRSLFTQSFHLSCGLPRFPQPSCFFISDLFGNLSSFILTMCPTHITWLLLTILSTILLSFSSLSFHRLFSLSSCSQITKLTCLL